MQSVASFGCDRCRKLKSSTTGTFHAGPVLVLPPMALLKAEGMFLIAFGVKLALFR